MNVCKWSVEGTTTRLCLAVALFAALVQVLFIFESHRQRAFQVPLVDAAAYHQQALALAGGQPAPPRAFWQPPLYPYALSLLYRAGITDLRTVRGVHGLMAVIAALLVFAIARRCAGPGAGLLAGLGVSVYGPLMFYFNQLLPTGLAVTLNLASLLLLMRLGGQPTWPRAFAVGLAIGLATLTVANSAVMVLVALGWIVVHADARDGRGRWHSAGGLAAALAGGVVLVVAPVTIRNYAVSGEFVPVSTNGGINLYLGNNPEPARTLTLRPGLDWDRLNAWPYRQGARTDAEADRFFVRKVTTFARQSPLAFARGLAAKVRQVLNSREIPRNEDLYAFTDQSRVLRALLWRVGSFAFPFGLVGPLAALGAVTLARRHRAGRLVLAFIGGYLATVVVFFPASRYQAPVMPALVICAVLGVRQLLTWAALTAPQRAGTAMGLALLAVGLNLPCPLPTDRVNHAAELHTFVGVGLQTRGRVDESLAEYREALRLDPGSADTHRFLGTAYRALNRTTEAIREFEQALTLRPDHDAAMEALAVMRYQQGRVAEAVALLRKALDLNPDNRQAMANLAVGLQRLNQPAEAAEWRRKADITPAARR